MTHEELELITDICDFMTLLNTLIFSGDSVASCMKKFNATVKIVITL